MLILFWNGVVSFTYAIVIFSALALPVSSLSYTVPFTHLVYLFLGAYAGISLIQMLFYPFGGLLADLRFGRYRMVCCSMISIWAGYIVLSFISILYLAKHATAHHFHPVVGLLVVIIGLLLITGFTGFQANAVQFGLDQLLDVPSKDLSVFLHWYVWADAVGTLATRLLGTGFLCGQKETWWILPYPPFLVVVGIAVLLIFTFYKRKWFHCEPRNHNPYGMVYRVLKFAARNNRPLRPSAFTYCDDEIPTRMEFAKQRYGGPFSTETVEDVKTFLRILVILLAIGPVFALHVPTIYVFPLFGAHAGRNKSLSDNCTVDWLTVQSNNLSYMFTIVLMPLYILIQPCAGKCLPRILCRLGIGIALLVASVLSMMVVDVLGHYQANTRNITNTSCLFIEEYRDKRLGQTLEFHTGLLIIPNLLTGIGVPIVFTTILEFISAQSPHTMKGLLLGVYYAIRGFFIILGCGLVFPFAQKRFWGDCKGKVFNCGFYYYLMNGVYGVLCLSLFWLAAKWYQYRVREDRPYGPSYVENYYSRYATMATSPEERESDRVLSQAHTYGAINK
jgi:peptide/histidine transporter 3/4